VGTDVASALLVAAGDNPERLKSEATFAKLCGVSPLAALWHIVFTRMVRSEFTLDSP
jgi:hypothetical protein